MQLAVQSLQIQTEFFLLAKEQGTLLVAPLFHTSAVPSVQNQCHVAMAGNFSAAIRDFNDLKHLKSSNSLSIELAVT